MIKKFTANQKIGSQLELLEVVFEMNKVDFYVNQQFQLTIGCEKTLIINEKQNKFFLVVPTKEYIVQVPITLEDIQLLFSNTNFTFTFVGSHFEGNALLKLPSNEILLTNVVMEKGNVTFKALKNGEVLTTNCAIDELTSYEMLNASILLGLFNGTKHSQLEIIAPKFIHKNFEQQFLVTSKPKVIIRGSESYLATICREQNFIEIEPFNKHYPKLRFDGNTVAAFVSKGSLILMNHPERFVIETRNIKELCETLQLHPKKMLVIPNVKGWIKNQKIQLTNVLLWINKQELFMTESTKTNFFEQPIDLLAYAGDNIVLGNDVLLEGKGFYELASILQNSSTTILHDLQGFPYVIELSDTLTISNMSRNVLTQEVTLNEVKNLKVEDYLQLEIGLMQFLIDEIAYKKFVQQNTFNHQKDKLMSYSVNQLLKPRAKQMLQLVLFESFSQHYYIKQYAEKYLFQPSYEAHQLTAHSSFIYQSMLQQRLRMEEIVYAIPRFFESITGQFITLPDIYKKLQKEMQQLHVTMKASTSEIESLCSQITYLHANPKFYSHQLKEVSDKASMDNLLVTSAIGLGMSALTGGLSGLIMPAITGVKMLSSKNVNETQQSILEKKELTRNLFHFNKIEQLLQQLFEVTLPEYICALKDIVNRFLKQEGELLVKMHPTTIEDELKAALIKHTIAINTKLSLPIHESQETTGIEIVKNIEKSSVKELIKFF